VSQLIFTIGAYGFDLNSFFETLEEAEVDVFLDIRQRRGLRGARYAFGNVGRLMPELERRDIAYRHIKELAPDSKIRDLQRTADAASGTLKSQRTGLSSAFVEAYTAEKLNQFDWRGLAEELRPFEAPVLFCVEQRPESCHRSLVAPRLADALHANVVNLMP
jgi:uncharacterized protein (DUF488 family)